MLPMPAFLGADASFSIIASQQMKQVRFSQLHRAIRLALFVDQQRERNARFLPELLCVFRTTKPYRGQRAPARPELRFVLAQLRNMLTAEDSTVVAQKDDCRGSALP